MFGHFNRFLLVAVLLAIQVMVHARSTTYTYTGGGFNTFSGYTGLTTKSRLNVTLVTPQPIPPNTTVGFDSGAGESSNPISWAANDGFYSYNSNQIDGTFLLTTDANGNIISWNFNFEGALGSSTAYYHFTEGSASSGHDGFFFDLSHYALGPHGSWRATVTILTPLTGASPQSHYVALTGTGVPNSQVALLLDDIDNLSDTDTIASVDSDGDWEKLLYVGGGTHTITAEEVSDTNDVSNSITVIMHPPFKLPQTLTDYSVLNKADIFLTTGVNSYQVKLYGATYTHTAIYLAGDINGSGTPMVAEAIPTNEGGVREVPLEMSSVWTDGKSVDIYRPKAALSKAQRSAIVNWARSVTSESLPYWNVSSDLIFPILWARLYWNSTANNGTGAPTNATKFGGQISLLNHSKQSTDRFICSTLVWRSYLEGSNGTLDLASPNNVIFAGLLNGLPANFIKAIQPYFVFPDTLALDGKLEKVN